MAARLVDCADPSHRASGIASAVSALQRGNLVVLPTDTVYGLACDAFRPASVARMAVAKRRDADLTVPVFVGSAATLEGIATGIGVDARRLVEAFWPGGLTLVCRQQPSLAWDLGDATGCIAVRMPLHPVALEVLRATGPLAVISAAVAGGSAPVCAAEALDAVGEHVAVVLDGGPCLTEAASTVVDVSTSPPTRLRIGAVSDALLREVVPSMLGLVDPSFRIDGEASS